MRWQWRTSEHAALAYWLKTSKYNTRQTLWPSFFFWKAGNKIPVWKLSSLYQKESHILIIKTELRSREFYTNRPCSSNSYLSLAFPHSVVTFSQLPLCSTYYKTRFHHVLGSSFLILIPWHTKLVLNKCVCFSPVDLSYVNLTLSPSQKEL